MYRCLLALLLTGAQSCNSNNLSHNTATVDSNVAGTPDSMPRRLHLDSFQKDTSVRVTLDSAGPTINPQDTVYPE
jgi:hypothetical protein